MKTLLFRGAKIDTTRPGRLTGLSSTINSGKREAMELLMEYIKYMPSEFEYSEALLHACLNGHDNTILFIKSLGLSFSSPDHWQQWQFAILKHAR